MLLGLSLGITWHQFDLPTSCFPTTTWTNKSSTNCLHSSPTDSFDTSAFLNLIYPPHSSVWLGPTCMSSVSQNRVGGRDIEWFLTSTPCMCVHVFVCVPLRLECFHTRHLRGKNECWWYCFRSKERTYVSHNYLQLQEICIPSFWTA